jgi:hypothetical protein
MLSALPFKNAPGKVKRRVMAAQFGCVKWTWESGALALAAGGGGYRFYFVPGGGKVMEIQPYRLPHGTSTLPAAGA